MSVWYNQLATVYRITDSQDAWGGRIETEAEIISSWPVNVQPLSGNERGMLGTVGVEVTHRACGMLPADATPAEKDLLVVSGVRYDIQAVLIMADHLELGLIERRR